METTRKSALVMADGCEVRDGLDELRAHFDAAQAVEHFKSGKLSAWLEERYYDAVAEKVGALKKEYDRMAEELQNEDPAFREVYEAMLPKDEDIAAFLCNTLGIRQTEGKSRVSRRTEEKRARLLEKTDDETILSHAGETAFTQEDLAELLDAGEKTIYLCGKEFEMPLRIGQTHYIGILGKPVVHVAAATPGDLKRRGITCANVTVDYLEDETENLLAAIREAELYDLSDSGEFCPLIFFETDGRKDAIKKSIRRAAEQRENLFAERMSERIDACLETLEDIQERYDRMHEARGVPVRKTTPELSEVRSALAEGHERIAKDMAGKLADELLSQAHYEMLDFNLLRGSDYMLDNANELDTAADQFQRKYAAQYGKRDMEGVVQSYLRSVRRGAERLRDMGAWEIAEEQTA